MNIDIHAAGTWANIPVLVLTLVLGTPVLSLVGCVIVALTLTRSGSGALRSLLVLPLFIPVLIFSTTLVDQASSGLPYTTHLYILSALLVLSATLAPILSAAALRIATE